MNVSTILGPAMNIKRSPLCGRNFEYYSEDPYVSTEMAAALIEGVQSKKVGTSAKHFVANNQEKRRMTNSSDMDERTLREIYLASFEGAIKKEKPLFSVTQRIVMRKLYSIMKKIIKQRLKSKRSVWYY